MGKVVVTLAVTCTALALVCLHLVNRLREGDATIAELQEQVANLQAGQQQRAALTPAPSSSGFFEVIERTPEATAPPKTAKEESEPAPAQGTAIASAALPRPSREESMRMFREHRERQRQLMQDPEYREAMRVQTRTNLARQYPGVIEELGLDPQQAESFFTLLADQQLRMQEQMEPFWEVTPQDERTDPTTIQQRHQKIQQTTSEIQRNNEAQLAALLGPQKMQAWKEYQSTVGQRWQLEQMNSTLAAQGMPLPDDLHKPVLKALAEVQRQEMQEVAARSTRIGPAATTPRFAASMGFQAPDMEQLIDNMKKRNQRMLDAISPYLTYEQRQALEKEYEAQIKMQEAQMRLQRARGENSGNNALYGFFSPGVGVVEATTVQPQ
jgi:hypothetical protein